MQNTLTMWEYSLKPTVVIASRIPIQLTFELVCTSYRQDLQKASRGDSSVLPKDMPLRDGALVTI